MKSIVELVNAAAEQVGALTVWDRCLTTGEWPGMPQTIQTISAPRWAHYTTDEEEYWHAEH